MRPYSNDLRRRIVEACAGGGYTQREAAELFGVSLATVKNFLRRQRQTASPDALPHGGGRPPILSAAARAFVQAAVKENNDLTLAELCRRVKGRHKRAVSRPTMSRLLCALGLPRKKSRSTPASATPPESSGRDASTDGE